MAGIRWTKLLFSLIIIGFNEYVAAQNTIGDMIRSRPDLSMIANYMQGTNTLNLLTQKTAKFTFYAPHNNAFMNVSDAVRNQLQFMPKASIDAIFQYHTAYNEYRTSLVSSTTPIAEISTIMTGSPNLFLVLEDDVYVNGARFLARDLDISSASITNGVLHIIDHIFINMVDPNFPSSNAYRYIHDNLPTTTSDLTSTKAFTMLLDTYNGYVSSGSIVPGPSGVFLKMGALNNDQAFVTTFVPCDRAMTLLQQNNIQMYQSLSLGSPAFLQIVVESHTILNHVYHSNLFDSLMQQNKVITGMRGVFRTYWFKGHYYVQNDCVSARVLSANTTVTNGVVYIIDNLLGYVYNDLITQILQDLSMSDFNGAVRSAPQSFQTMLTVPQGVTIPEEKKLTVFAATKLAFQSGEIDFSQDQATKLLQLEMQVVNGILQLTAMENGTVVNTQRPGYPVRFYHIGTDRYAEVDYVRARIISTDICTKNGVIFKTDKILGVPSRTVYGEVAHNPMLFALNDVVRDTGVQQTLNDMTRQITLFAPVDQAFVLLRSTEEGNAVLNRQNLSKLRNLMLRQMVKGTIFLDTIPNNGQATYSTYFDSISVTNQNGDYYVIVGNTRIHVIQPNMRMKNGVVHLVSMVLFDPTSPVAADALKSGAKPAASILTWTSLLILLLCTVAASILY